MADLFKPLQAQPFLLAGAGAVIGDTTLTFQSLTQIDGTLITMSILGSVAFMTLEPGNGTLEEQISFTGVTQNSNGTATLTGIKTVLFAYPYTQTPGLAKTHAGSSTGILSNTSGFYNQFVAKNDDGTIGETLTFTQPFFPQMDGVGTPPSLPAQLVTKSYADGLAIAGAPNASTSVKGLVQIATQAQVDAKTIIGSTSAYLSKSLDTQRSTLLSDYVIDTSPTPNVIVITPSPAISSYIAGQTFSFKLANTNTSPTVSINVNGVGAQNIVKLNGATSPAASDMALGQIITVEYDGTNFQMLNPVANAPATLASVTKFGGTGVDGALTSSSGVTTINLANASTVTKNYTSISLTGTAQLAFSNPNTNGTVIILKSQGNVTITGSTSPTIDLRLIGAQTTTGTYGFGLISGPDSPQATPIAISGGGTPITGAPGGAGVHNASTIHGKGVNVFAGASGSAGTSNVTAAGKGGGGLYIECGGTLNFTGTIDVSGQAGTNGTSQSANFSNGGSGGGGNVDGVAGTVSATGSGTTAGGGGGGGGGACAIIYNALTANSGTITMTGGAGGTGGAGAAGAGGTGWSLVTLNTEFN